MRAWMSSVNDALAHFVLLINGAVALVAGFFAAASGRVSVEWGFAIAGVIFVGLTACLLSRTAALVAAFLGSGLSGLVAGAVGSAFVAGQVASWFVGGLSGVSAFALVFHLYRRFVRVTTGGGEMEGRFVGTFNERDHQMRKGSGAATLVVSATDAGDHDLRVTGLVVGGVTVDLHGKRREGEMAADLSKAGATPGPFELLRGKASIHGDEFIVDLEGAPFGSYVFTGNRQRG